MNIGKSLTEAEAFAKLRQYHSLQLEDSRRRSAVRLRLQETLHAKSLHKVSLAPRMRKGLWTPNAWGGLGVAACAAVLLLWIRIRPFEQPLTFVAADTAQEEGRYISAPDHEKMPLRFSDGSRVTLNPGTSARVEKLQDNGATVRIEDGAANIEVVHRENTRWRVEGGPYTVHVVGTRFRAEWDPRTRRFSVEMHDGEVRVQGPGIDANNGQGKALKTGEKLSQKVGHEGTGKQLAEANARKAGKEIAPKVVEGVDQEPVAKVPTKVRPTRTRSKNWLRLAKQGKHSKALASLDSASFADALKCASGKRLAQLGTTARLAGDRMRERRVYLAMRTRLPGTAWGSEAAFFLARLDQEVGTLRDAEQWLRIYRGEARGGRWAREAQGRLIETLHRRARQEEAEVEARDYLRAYPNSGYGKLARSVLENEKQTRINMKR